MSLPLHPLRHVQHRCNHLHHRESGKCDRTRSDGQNGGIDNLTSGSSSFGVPPANGQPNRRRQKVEAFQAQVGIKDPVEAVSMTVNPVLANPLVPSASLSSMRSEEPMEDEMITNPIHSSTLAPATRDLARA
jgi:hypothetical protein